MKIRKAKLNDFEQFSVLYVSSDQWLYESQESGDEIQETLDKLGISPDFMEMATNEYAIYSKKRFESDLKDKKRTIYVFEEKNKIIGFIQVKTYKTSKSKNRVVIFDWKIDKKLIPKSFELLQENYSKETEYETCVSNDNGLKILKSLGFKGSKSLLTKSP